MVELGVIKIQASSINWSQVTTPTPCYWEGTKSSLNCCCYCALFCLDEEHLILVPPIRSANNGPKEEESDDWRSEGVGVSEALGRGIQLLYNNFPPLQKHFCETTLIPSDYTLL